MDLVCSFDDEQALAAYRPYFDVVSSVPQEAGFYLCLRQGVLALCRGADSSGVHIAISDVRRRLRGDFLLGRACGINRSAPVHILDGTAGLGVDGLALALAGQRVTLVEREPVLWALLHNLLERSADLDVLLELDDCARQLVRAAQMPYDVIYLDPMFPARGKNALPGKRLQYLAELLHDAEPFDEDLLELAQTRARSRVVVKRRLKDPALGRPDWSIRGRSVRYDVFQGRG